MLDVLVFVFLPSLSHDRKVKSLVSGFLLLTAFVFSFATYSMFVSKKCFYSLVLYPINCLYPISIGLII